MSLNWRFTLWLKAGEKKMGSYTLCGTWNSSIHIHTCRPHCETLCTAHGLAVGTDGYDHKDDRLAILLESFNLSESMTHRPILKMYLYSDLLFRFQGWLIQKVLSSLFKNNITNNSITLILTWFVVVSCHFHQSIWCSQPSWEVDRPVLYTESKKNKDIETKVQKQGHLPKETW